LGTDNWTSGPDFRATLLRAGHPSCYLNFPRFTTGDIQTAAEYVVNGIRVMRRRAGRRIGVYGISQGALMPRWALTYWPRLRRQVADVVAVAGTQHGTTGGPIVSVLIDSTCRPTAAGCASAFWQQAVGSHLLKALNSRSDDPRTEDGLDYRAHACGRARAAAARALPHLIAAPRRREALPFPEGRLCPPLRDRLGSDHDESGDRYGLCGDLQPRAQIAQGQGRATGQALRTHPPLRPRAQAPLS
jgi:hypothetical protein